MTEKKLSVTRCRTRDAEQALTLQKSSGIAAVGECPATIPGTLRERAMLNSMEQIQNGFMFTHSVYKLKIYLCRP